MYFCVYINVCLLSTYTRIVESGRVRLHRKSQHLPAKLQAACPSTAGKASPLRTAPKRRHGSTCMYVCMYVCMYIYIYIYSYRCVCICTIFTLYICIYTSYMYKTCSICVCIYIHIHICAGKKDSLQSLVELWSVGLIRSLIGSDKSSTHNIKEQGVLTRLTLSLRPR